MSKYDTINGYKVKDLPETTPHKIKMTAHEALWLIKTQLAKTEQNIQAVQVLEEIVKTIHRVRIDDDYGTERQHMINHMNKVAKKDIKELKDNMCARYDWAEDDELVQFYELCEDDNGK